MLREQSNRPVCLRSYVTQVAVKWGQHRLLPAAVNVEEVVHGHACLRAPLGLSLFLYKRDYRASTT